MNETPSTNLEASPPPARRWDVKGRIFGVPISLVAIWAALFVAASAIPALPVPGMAGVITVNAIMTAISGVVLGPAAAIANMAGGIISMLLFPYGAFLGPLSFLPVCVGGLVAGVLFADRWKLAGVIELLVVAAWFVNPASWSTLMWVVPLPYTAIVLLVIFIGPLRRWARRQILTLDKARIWPAMFLFVTVAHSAEYLTTNSMVNWMYNLSWQYWVPTWPYWVGVDTVIIIISTIIGVGVLTGLRRARLPHAAEYYRQ